MEFTLTITGKPEEIKKVIDSLSETSATVSVHPITKQEPLSAPTPTDAPVQPATPPQVPTTNSSITPTPTAVPVQSAIPATTPSAVPTAPQTYTFDQLAVAATQLVDAGRVGEVQQLLASFGVQALTMLPKEQYGAFATALRQMGAKI